MGHPSYLRMLWALRPPIVTFGVLLLGLPIIYSVSDEEMTQQTRTCLYCLVVMAVVWITEALPISATALFPLVMFPMGGVLTAADTASAYIGNTNMLFVGGLIFAVAVEEWNLHKRIAVMVMMAVGSDPKWIMAGLMLPTWFLSMWISNTATASMMIPIAAAVLEQMKHHRPVQKVHHPSPVSDIRLQQLGSDGENAVYLGQVKVDEKQNVDSSTDPAPLSDATIHETAEKVLEEVAEDEAYTRKCKALSLCIAYAANIGGIATLTGTPPNLVLTGAADPLYDSYRLDNETKNGSPVSYSNWMGMALPLSAICLVIAWFVLLLVFLARRGCMKQDTEQALAVKSVIREEWRKLGRIQLVEVELIILFFIMALLWLTRKPTPDGGGWAEWFKPTYVSDTTSAMLIAILLFILPAKIPNVFCFWTPERRAEKMYTPILTWEQVHRKLPWGVIILLGGGFALARGVTKSGLSVWLADKLLKLSYMDTWVLNLVMCLIVAAFTEVTSNTATANILMPILSSMSISLGVNPLYFMSSACIATSFAFMLPVATPPNAIVFSYGHVHVIDMVRVGFFMNVLTVAVLTLAVNTWGDAIFDFGTLDPIFLRKIVSAD